MDTDDLIVDFNAVLTSGGGSLSERQFMSDYRGLIGKLIPFRELGHNSLKSLLLSLGGFYFSNRGGETYIHAQVDERTAHITSLIARQKKKPGDKKRAKRSSLYSRPKLPPRLTRLEFRHAPVRTALLPTPVPRTALLSTPCAAREPPAPRYGNPPIIPQRQPLPLMQKQIEKPKEETKLPLTLPSVQGRLERGSVINKREAEARILSDNSVVNSRSPETNAKGSVLIQRPVDDAVFVDIQWLQGKITTPPEKRLLGGDLKGRNSSGESLPPSATPPAVKLTAPVVMPSPAPKPVPLMNLKLGSPKPASSPQKTRGKLPEQKVTFKSHVDELSTLAFNLGFGDPVYKFIERRPSRGKPVYVAKVKLGSSVMFSSYPEEQPTREQAQELVSKVACEDLRKRLNRQTSSESINASEVLDRIFEIVKLKSNGMFDQAVINAYEETFKTSLPPSWLETIQESSKFSVERYEDSKAIIYPVNEASETIQESSKICIERSEDSKAIIYPVNEGSCSVDSRVEQSSDARSILAPAATVVAPASPMPETIAPLTNGHTSSVNGSLKQRLCKDINANSVSLSEPRKLPELLLPSEPMWDVYVASVGGPDIWVRLIGDAYDAQYNDIINDLEIKMLSTNGQGVTNPLQDELYCAKFDNCWLRVQLRDVTDEGECVVFLVDNGEEDTIPISELRVLDDEFLSLAAQAIQCRLSYVDVTYDAAQSYLMTQVIGSSFVAEVLQYPAEENIANIVLHNTDVEGGAININYCILEEIIKSLEKPQLPQRHVAFVRITHVDKETPPFVQIKGRDLTFLEDILNEIYLRQDLVELHGVNAHPRLMNINENQMFLVHSPKYPETWRRGIIVNIEDSRNPRVFFVDYGHHENVKLSGIFDIDKVMPALKKFPRQAIQVNIANLPASELNMGVVHRLRELVPADVFVIGKVANADGGLQPEVEFFKRVQPDNMIASINSDLLFHYDEYSKRLFSEEEKTEQICTPSKGSLGSTDPLKSFSIPPVGSDFFDVFVSMSSNPSNFVVQPVKERNSSFNSMMKELQELYEAQHSVMPVPIMEDLLENAAFAAKHPDPDDHLWYRVSIVAALNDSMVSVRYSDFGDVGLVAIDQLRYLEPRFKQIPALAIRATLHGVEPKNMDWSVDNCVYFNDLVVNKPFVSKVLRVNNESNFSSWQVSLQLIDTTKENMDIDVAAELIKGGIAVKVG